MTKIKICGITLVEDALYCAQLKADFLGFIFYPLSKRYIEVKKAEKIIDSLDNNTKTVGVFVNEKASVINKIAADLNLNYVQLHGIEPVETCNKIKVPYIKNIRSIKEVDIYKNASYYLVDAIDTTNWGGVGKLSDWSLARKIKDKGKKLILSGGLNKDNINLAIEKVEPNVVDICSSLEKIPGIKNHSSIKDFFDRIKLAKE